VPGLGASFGRGAATNPLEDMANSDCILFMGSNMAEAHPVGFRWPMKAKEKGATLIHVDPRFTRMSAVCDVYVGIRSGSDIVFLGALVNYILTNDRWFHEYVLAYTNASTIIEEGFEDSEDLGGLFSGFDQQDDAYDPKAGDWSYDKYTNGVAQTDSSEPAPQAKAEKGRFGLHGHGLDGSAEPAPYTRATGAKYDPTLQDPRCVMQILRRHFARYTPEIVSQVCGCKPEEFLRVAELLCANSGRERTACIAYSLGWTQHTTGVQTIRTAGIVQLLLGNAGRPGGGIIALRGHSTIQGASDISTLYDTLPGYLPQPHAYDGTHETLGSYIQHEGMRTGYWANTNKFIVSLLKAWYGDAATKENDFGFSWIPRVEDDYSMLPYFDRMSKGAVKGYFLMGMDPAGGGPACATSSISWSWIGLKPRAPCFGRTIPTGHRPRKSRPRCSSFPRQQLKKKKAAYPTRSDCSNGITRPSIRWAIPVPTPGFSTTWANASSSSTPAPPIRKISRC
jgi:formate dehydrogenase major subunit